jgi:hypothetical protein
LASGYNLPGRSLSCESDIQPLTGSTNHQMTLSPVWCAWRHRAVHLPTADIRRPCRISHGGAMAMVAPRQRRRNRGFPSFAS